MEKTVLSAKGLCKSFAHNGIQNHVISNVNIDFYEGDFTIVMGSSGSGKSTMLYSLSGMDRATGGEVIYNGGNIVEMSEKMLSELRHSDFGFVFQQMHLVSNLTLFENVAVPGYINKERSVSSVKKRAEMLLDKMGLTDVISHLPSQVSGGQQQRCAIARAIINEPTLLFADEPTGALNRKNTTEVLDLLTELNSEGQSIIMVTHDMRAALRGSRIVYIDDGKVVGDLKLPEYQPEEESMREKQVNSWLSSMGW